MGEMHFLQDLATASVAEVHGVRSLFPVLEQPIQGAALAYLDNAATTQVPRPVLAAMRHFEEHDRANIHRGVHTLSQRATDAFERARTDLKRFVGAGPGHELVFTSGTTEALNLVANGLSAVLAGGAFLQPGDQIDQTWCISPTSQFQHGSNMCMHSHSLASSTPSLHPSSSQAWAAFIWHWHAATRAPFPPKIVPNFSTHPPTPSLPPL